jgi:hypothetical protein
MAVKQVPWQSVDDPVAGLATNASHAVQVQREAIPIIFVPGVMGSRLRLSGTDGAGKTNGLPNLRWDPTAGFLFKNFSGVTPARRKLRDSSARPAATSRRCWPTRSAASSSCRASNT